MRADDFVTGDSARGAGQSSLVGTESTNAVNTGLVGSAAAIAKNMVIGGTELGDVDKMYQAGKSAVKGSVNAARAGSDLVKDTVDTAKTTAKAFKAGLNGEDIDLSGTKSRSGKNLAKGAKKAAKDGFRAAKRAAIKDSELEDVDNLYQEAKGLNNGTNEEYTRTQAAGSFDIDGIDDGLSEILGNAKDTIEDYVREQCALFYPTAVKASCNGILTADFNANEYRLDFSLEDSDEQQLTGITVIYHLSNQECELM